MVSSTAVNYLATSPYGDVLCAPQRNRRLLQDRSSLSSVVQLMVDYIVVAGTLLFLLFVKDGASFSAAYYGLLVVTALLMLIFYGKFGAYSRHTTQMGTLIKLAKAWGAVIISLSILAFTIKASEVYSRQVIYSWVILGFVLQFVAHYLFTIALIKHKGRAYKDPVIIIGATRLGQHLAAKINANPWIREEVIGVVDKDPESLLSWDGSNAPALGDMENIVELIDIHKVKSVYITVPMDSAYVVKNLYNKLQDKNVNINWAPDIFDMALVNHSLRELAGTPVLTLSETPLIGTNATLKMALDKTLASIILVLASPVMLITALAIKLTSPGAVFFKQQRHGWDGKLIEVYKFRSMHAHKEEDGHVSQATREDTRITPVGRFIRRTSIDELPQLFNVLQGSMSLVGPRPHAVEHNNYYSKNINAYLARHRILPGMTGLAQVEGFRGETETIEKMQKRVEHDMIYINNWSILLDFKILFRTAFVLLSHNAY